MTKIAFLGAGRMASAMVGGLLTKAAATPADLACTSGPDDTAQQLSARTGILPVIRRRHAEDAHATARGFAMSSKCHQQKRSSAPPENPLALTFPLPFHGHPALRFARA